ncbi:fibronectin type III domain-containing protein 4-like isoform X2 [Phycodurus eques]|uniref:fibronectin type III domain-containing protein 4-like isoform X2 n=1 Tax=Phycodurus eques TaxID=693459 RepID=UPI002ACE8198|nr:fibronectin type III domain-containing protein 4-like isoform X2 [Phycodurus eques]
MCARSQEVMSAFPHLDTRLPLSQMMIMMMGCLMVGGTVPAAPVNVSVTQLRAHSAMVTWNVPLGDTVIGYAISQQRQDGLMQRSIREVNTSSRWCVLWDLDEDTHYSVQVQSVGLQGDSQPSRAIHFRTLERSDHYPAGVLDHHEPAMEGLGMSPHLQTGELLIITTVLLLWAVRHHQGQRLEWYPRKGQEAAGSSCFLLLQRLAHQLSHLP